MIFMCAVYTYALEIDAKIKFIETEDGYRVDATNNEPFDVYVIINIVSVGFEPTVSFPTSIRILHGNTKGVLVLKKLDRATRYRYRSSHSFAFSDPDKVKPDDYLYFFPFAHGTAHRLVQGWNGSFSHRGQNQYALDFDLPKGTKVYAAHGGLVVSIKEDSKVGGLSCAYSNSANYVMILHDDGTIGNYVHLQYAGALVDKGDTVQAGDVIGLSGATGLASGPHLHFDVRVPSLKWPMQSVPFYFRGKDGTAITPKEGHTYYAWFPGGADFTGVHGSDFTIEQFADYSADIAKDFPVDTLKIRQEIYDDTVLLFLENGFSKPVKVTVSLGLVNTRSQIPLPITVTIPSRKESFLTIAKIIDLTKRIAVRARMKFVLVE